MIDDKLDCDQLEELQAFLSSWLHLVALGRRLGLTQEESVEAVGRILLVEEVLP
jgi:hypothetical protein